VKIAKRNAARHDLETKIAFFCSDWMQSLKQNIDIFDLIVSNPPYVVRDDIAGLQPEIRRYEPFDALNGGGDGLDSLRQIIGSAHHYLRPGGWLALEIGAEQKDRVQCIAADENQYDDFILRKDYSDLDRVVLLRKN